MMAVHHLEFKKNHIWPRDSLPVADRYNIAVENAFSVLGDLPEDPEEAWSITRVIPY